MRMTNKKKSDKMLQAKKRNSIYVQLLQLLVFSALAAFLLYGLLDYGTMSLMDRYLTDINYVQGKDRRYVRALQDYVEKEQIISSDTDAIYNWVMEQKVISLYIYKDGYQIFDSDHPGEAVWEEKIPQEEYQWETYYPVEFADGMTQVNLSGAYGYQFYIYALIVELLVSFGFFLLLVLLGIRKKMWYITELSREIEILEGGSLDYPVTVQGEDELASLAEGLDAMRLSFRELLKKEEEMMRENQKIVTEMSHDLRTPVTSILLYTEILKKENGENGRKQQKYLDIIEKKARRMKQLADHLFEYSLITGEENVQLEEPETMAGLLYDLFSETCGYLEQKGFSVDFHVEWTEEKIRISMDYMMRILDNITSNLIKYADPAYPVMISSPQESPGVVFENRVRLLEEKPESTGIGLQSIRKMMEKMGGNYLVEQVEDRFRLTLFFPSAEAPAAP